MNNIFLKLFYPNGTISNKKFILNLVVILLSISILLGVTVSYYTKKFAIKNLAHNDMVKTSELVFEVLYSKMEDGWDKGDINYTISKLNQLQSGMKIETYRSKKVSELYGATDTVEIIQKDPQLQKAFKGEEQTLISDTDIRFLYVIRNEQKCLQCHANSDLGDINGVIDISMPLQSLMIPLDTMIQILLFLLILFLILIFLGLYYILNRNFVNPMVAFGKELEKICPYDSTTNTISIKSNILEIKELESSFNDLLAQYREAIDQLQKNEKLIGMQSRQAAMGEMIGMIAHQWRQPITVIAMDVNNIMVDIEMDTYDTQEIKTLLKHILKQTQHLSNTIDDFSDFFKPDKRLTQVKLSDLIDETLKIIGKSLESHQIQFELVDHSNGEVEVYEREFVQVLLNIINNAKEALQESNSKNPKISCEIVQRDQTTKITISDNGNGIDEAIVDKVFDPYFSTKKQKNGTGIGLYMCQNIIQKHFHGSITAQNNKQGASFTITIPNKII